MKQAIVLARDENKKPADSTLESTGKGRTEGRVITGCTTSYNFYATNGSLRIAVACCSALGDM